MGKNKTKEWRKPEIAVLARSNAEEAVLTPCKFASMAGPNSKFVTCAEYDPECMSGCSGYGAS